MKKYTYFCIHLDCNLLNVYWSETYPSKIGEKTQTLYIQYIFSVSFPDINIIKQWGHHAHISELTN